MDISSIHQSPAITHGEQATATNQADNFNPSAVMPAVSELQFSGDPGAMLAALTMGMAKDESKNARLQRDRAMDAQDKAEASEIKDLRTKATLQLARGIVDGTLQIASGLCDLGKGINDANAASSTNSKDIGGDKTRAAWFGAGSSMAKATQSVADGVFDAEITNKDADEKMHEAAADTFKKFAEDARDDEKDAKDLMTKALDFYKEYVDTKNQTTMAAIHRA